jgi:hypothetical protein
MLSTRSAVTARIDAVIWSLERHDLAEAETLAEKLWEGLNQFSSPRWDSTVTVKIGKMFERGIQQIRRGAGIPALKEFHGALRQWLQQVERK